ncbi:MAG TPA: DUF2927 domain-containing protein [Albidovulum sp.]|uniref:DUF2927 domain-containing protein n=1 Tax=Albidovulum sp. TaxID=1872424 RepID=UPI002CCD5836|nr:DUF2927 domain-containing protein [Albidovulum sp.]
MTPFRVLGLALLLAGCGAAPPPPDAGRLAVATGPLPAMRQFSGRASEPPGRSNADMARDFLDLSFRLETGRDLPVLTRFEGPVTLRVAGPMPAVSGRDLDRLLVRLRQEAGIDITRTNSPDASITVEFISGGRLRGFVPRAACFVAPRVSSWAEYRSASRATLDWATLTGRDRAAIFIPDDTAPQEIRDCLHEELAQALGPLNDLFRLPDSVFNDDNMNAVLTGFDMLMLRTTYAPVLASGMGRDEVAARLPAILNRLNPAGDGRAARFPGPTPDAYARAVETALGPGAGRGARKVAARTAVNIAQSEGWTDTRAGFAWLILGRLSLTDDPVGSADALMRAGAIYHNDPLLWVQSAHADMQLAAFALTQGDADLALRLADLALPRAAAAENAALMANLMAIRAEALDLTGNSSEADRVRLDSLGWARYGFGGDQEVWRQASEIASLSPRKR